MPRSISFFVLIFLTALSAKSQELNCRVTVNADQIQNTERRVFDLMEEEFSNFLNDRKWSDDRFEVSEKVGCMIQITLDDQPEIGSYSAVIQVVSVRPTFNTNYQTSMINFADRDFNFDYTESQPLNFNETSFSSNLTSVLGFYAYIILGYDYDSFSNLGGENYFEKALQVVNSAQSSGFNGWSQFGSNVRSRYWWSQNSLDQVMQPFREAMYEYHIKGLDLMGENAEEARTNVLEALKKVQAVNKAKPRSIMVISFLDAKADEIVSIFSEGDMAVRRQAVDILREMDPAHTEDYQKILTN